MIETKELLSEEKIKMFEEDQKEYSTETALHNYMWLLLDQIFRGLGVTDITTADSVGIHDSVKATVTQNEEVLEDKPEDFSKDDVKRETVESEDLQVPETSDIDEEILD